MSVFRKIGCALARFMYGRNGIDQLGQTLIWAGLIADLVSMFTLRRVPLLGTILYYVAAAIWLWAILRMFSKNLPRRQAENSRWLQFLWNIKNSAGAARTRHADKEHKYFTCKICGTICRVPAGKGSIVITCPKCGAQIKGKT